MAGPLAVLAVVAFLPAVGNGFVDLDDPANFLYNPHYRGLGGAQLGWAWTTDWVGVYQPLAWMLLGAEYSAFGLDPRGYHLTSLLLHALSALALYALTLALLGRACPGLRAANPDGVVLGSALAVALFVAHPLRVEVVAWASCQSYLPCSMFAALAVVAYLRADGASPRRRGAWLFGSWVLLALALLCKAAAVALPAVLVVLDVYPLRRLGGGPCRWFGPSARRLWAEKTPFVALSAVFAALAVWAKWSNYALVPLEQHGPLSRVVHACYSAVFYLWKTVWPTGLCAYYPASGRFDWREPTYLACLGLVAAASAVLFVLRRRHPGLLAAWLAYLALLAPNSGLVTIGGHITADRYSLLTTMTGVPLLAAGIARLTRPGRGRAAITSTLGVLVVVLVLIADLVGSSWSLCRTWRDTVALATRAIEHGGRSPDLYLGLGSGLQERGDIAGAEASFREALRLEPLHVPSLIHLGMIRLRQRRPAEATTLLTAAVRLEPGVPETHNTLGTALAAQGRLDEAIAEFTAALRLRPDFPDARRNLSLLLSRTRTRGPGR
jgi:tetratricopeptide (TPR) repeat protein